MPQSESPPVVSFQTPVYNDSQQVASYRTVHVVVMKPKEKEGHSAMDSLGIPLITVLLISIAILFFASRIKAGSKTDNLLKRLEKVSTLIDRKVEKDDIT